MTRTSGSLLPLLVLVPVTAWSLNFTIAKYALDHGFSPLAYTAPRFLCASAAFCALALKREGTLRVARKDIPALVAAGIVGICLNQLAFVYSLQHNSATTVALLFGTLPIFVGVLSHITRHERLGRRQWIATIVSCGGVALVVLGVSATVSSDAVGIVLAIAAPLTWAMYSVGAAHLLHRYSPLRISAIVCLIGTVPLTLLSIGPLAKEQWGSLGLGAWAALLYGALIGYVLATIVWFVAIRRIGAPRASLYQNLQPFLGALFAVVLLSEGLTWIEIIGGAVIGCALLIARKRAPAPTTYDLEAQP